MVCASLVLIAGPGSTNVIPGDPKVGTTALTRMWCYQGTVTFRIVGPGVSVVVGTTQAGPLPEGKAELTFTVPNLPAGKYTMVGSGLDCIRGLPYEVRVDFVIRADGPIDPEYPPNTCSTRLSAVTASPGDQATAITNCFTGLVSFSFGSSGLALGTAPTGADGISSLTFTVPDVPDGDYSVGATGTSPSGRQTSVSTMLSVVKSAVVAPKPPVTVPEAPATTAVNTDVVSSNNPAVADAPAVAVLGVVEQRADVATVAASGGNRGGLLARSGANALSLARVALVVVAAGGLLMFATSRRTRRS